MDSLAWPLVALVAIGAAIYLAERGLRADARARAARLAAAKPQLDGAALLGLEASVAVLQAEAKSLKKRLEALELPAAFGRR